MTLIRFWLLFALLCLSQTAPCQSPASFSQEWTFARYLADKDATDEAGFVLQHIDQQRLAPAQRDSLAYLTGWLAYGTKSLDSASRYLLAVSSQSPFYVKSRYFGAYCLAFDTHLDSARAVMQTLPAPDSTLAELKAVQLAGLALLQRQFVRYDSLRQQFSYASYALSAEETRLDAYRRGLTSEKRRSPVLAGALSAVEIGRAHV